jgi:hypothetical protein
MACPIQAKDARPNFSRESLCFHRARLSLVEERPSSRDPEMTLAHAALSIGDSRVTPNLRPFIEECPPVAFVPCPSPGHQHVARVQGRWNPATMAPCQRYCVGAPASIQS